MKTRVCVANVAKYLGPRAVAHDTKKAFQYGNVVMFNEMSTTYHRRLLKHYAGTFYRRLPHPNSKVQVAVPSAWKVKPYEHTLTRSMVPVNPARRISVAFCEEKDRTVFVAFHLTNGAWNRKRKVGKRLRMWLWRRQVKELRRLVARWHAFHWNVVLAGDANRYVAPLVHDEQRSVGREYMHIIVCPRPGRRARLTDYHVERDVRSDHPQVSVNVTFLEEK